MSREEQNRAVEAGCRPGMLTEDVQAFASAVNQDDESQRSGRTLRRDRPEFSAFRLKVECGFVERLVTCHTEVPAQPVGLPPLHLHERGDRSWQIEPPCTAPWPSTHAP